MSRSQSALPVANGAVIGAGAFVAGLLLTFVLGQAGINRSLTLLTAIAPVDGTILAFSTFHLWPQILGGSTSGGPILFTVVPFGLLLASGYVVASRSGAGDGFLRGASVTVGYFALTLLAYGYLFSLARASASMQITVDLVVAILVTGVVFPAIVGGIGGLVADSV